ncbi:hypothetical protein N7488_008582 [Penicillium malachiteum]|nr:hypothetical protein N7488_008582 [Penicillium malachiteum]
MFLSDFRTTFFFRVLIIPLIFKLRGKGLEEKDANGQSPLLIAAENAQFQAIRVLIESGACLDALNNKH